MVWMQKKSPWAEPTEKITKIYRKPLQKADSVGSMELVGIGMGEFCLGDKRFQNDFCSMDFCWGSNIFEELETGFARFT